MEVKRIPLLTIACLCHKGIHMTSLCASYGNVLRKILPNKRRRSRWAHSESAVNTPLVNERMTESVHTTSLWPSWNGKSGKSLFILKLAHAYIQMCLENHFLFINSYTHIQVYIYPTQVDRCTYKCSHSSKHDQRLDWLADNLFCFMPHWCICRFNIDIITIVLLQQACALMLWAWLVFLNRAPTVGYCGLRS